MEIVIVHKSHKLFPCMITARGDRVIYEKLYTDWVQEGSWCQVLLVFPYSYPAQSREQHLHLRAFMSSQCDMVFKLWNSIFLWTQCRPPSDEVKVHSSKVLRHLSPKEDWISGYKIKCNWRFHWTWKQRRFNLIYFQVLTSKVVKIFLFSFRSQLFWCLFLSH